MPLIPQTLARISTSRSSLFIHRSDVKYEASTATKYTKLTFQTLLACDVNTHPVLVKYPGTSYQPFKFTTLLHTPLTRTVIFPQSSVGKESACSSTGARLRPQVAGRRRPTATWARAADPTPPPRFHHSDWAPYPSGVQDGGRGRGSWPSKAAIGEAQAFGAERRPQ